MDQLLKVEARIAERIKLLGNRPVDFAEFEPASMKKRNIDYFVPLKPYVSEREKGVCYIAFEHRWARFVHHYRDQLEAFAKRYLLIVHPVWATPHGLINYYLPSIWPGEDPVFACVSDPHDLDTLPRQSPCHVIIPRYCSHWVNPAVYPQVPFEKKRFGHRDAGELRQIQTPLRVVQGVARHAAQREGGLHRPAQ